MNSIELDMMRGMVSILNEAIEARNNGNPIMTEEQFDTRLNDLNQLETESGFILTNSPTQNVKAKKLNKIERKVLPYRIVDLNKCNTIKDIVNYVDDKELVTTIKLDGIGVQLLYRDGTLEYAMVEHGDNFGFEIIEHIKHFKNVPFKINKNGTYIVKGEAIITDKDFADLNENNEFVDSKTLVKDTLTSLDTSLVGKRMMKFFVWDVVDGYSGDKFFDILHEAGELGFDVVPYWYMGAVNPKKLQSRFDYMFDYADEERLPYSGIVFKFNDIEYAKFNDKNGIIYDVSK